MRHPAVGPRPLPESPGTRVCRRGSVVLARYVRPKTSTSQFHRTGWLHAWPTQSRRARALNPAFVISSTSRIAPSVMVPTQPKALCMLLFTSPQKEPITRGLSRSCTTTIFGPSTEATYSRYLRHASGSLFRWSGLLGSMTTVIALPTIGPICGMKSRVSSRLNPSAALS